LGIQFCVLVLCHNHWQCDGKLRPKLNGYSLVSFICPRHGAGFSDGNTLGSHRATGAGKRDLAGPTLLPDTRGHELDERHCGLPPPPPAPQRRCESDGRPPPPPVAPAPHVRVLPPTGPPGARRTTGGGMNSAGGMTDEFPGCEPGLFPQRQALIYVEKGRGFTPPQVSSFVSQGVVLWRGFVFYPRAKPARMVEGGGARGGTTRSRQRTRSSARTPRTSSSGVRGEPPPHPRRVCVRRDGAGGEHGAANQEGKDSM